MSDLLTASETIIKHGLDWEVEKVPIFNENGGAIKDFTAIRRKDKIDRVFQIAGSRYQVVQNRDCFRFFDGVVSSGQAKYIDAGSWKNGAIIWIKASIPHDYIMKNGDLIQAYLMLITSHDGSHSMEIYPQLVRQVCVNTLLVGETLSTGSVKARHTENVERNFLSRANSSLQKEIEYFHAFFQKAEEMAKKEMTELEIDNFLDRLFNSQGRENDSTQLKNEVEAVKVLTKTGTGITPEMQGTAWGVYNAVTEFVDKRRPTKNGQREYSAMFGSGAALREKAYSLLSQ